VTSGKSTPWAGVLDNTSHFHLKYENWLEQLLAQLPSLTVDNVAKTESYNEIFHDSEKVKTS